ncbi:GldM family protein [Flavobacterium beibuense]|uniref:Gliding motility-associated protein GldM n=1 Tax=Flavobacterium beibuense TaxID=657326 RepID=A0A444WH39_9FLAO|nr:GldM family protein [Flavobacterium beibuense]RYJ45127.1 Gliding motility-associated protein GldM [Flavobacterium beibuense]
MKQTFFFLFLFLTSQLLTAQTNNISVISVEKANIVYRGISNPIKIAVPEAKSYNVTSSGKLTKKDSLGNYYLNVNGIQGKTVKINIETTLANDSIIKEYKEFEVRDIPRPRANIISSYNGGACEMTLSQLKELKLNVVIDNMAFNFDQNYSKVMSFIIKAEGYENIWIEGDSITPKAYSVLKNLKAGTELYIYDVHQYNPHNYCLRSLGPIIIKIVEEVNYDIPVPEVTTQYNSNIVYRGIKDTLKISVPNAKSFKVKGKGLKVLPDSIYVMDVGKIKKDKTYLEFEIVNQNDSVIYTKELLYVKNRDTSPKKITVNGKGCSNCIQKMTLQELKDAVIDITEDDEQSSLTQYVVLGFNIQLPDGSNIDVNNNIITDTVFEQLSTLQQNSIIEIDVFYSLFSYSLKLTPLKVMIVSE